MFGLNEFGDSYYGDSGDRGGFFTKLFTETVTLTDSLRKAVQRSRSEIITLVGSILVNGSIRVSFADSVTLGEAMRKSVSRLFSETITLINRFRLNGSVPRWSKISRAIGTAWTKIAKTTTTSG